MNWLMLSVGVVTVLIVTLIIYYLAEWVVVLLPLSRWWRGYVYIVAGFLSGLSIMWVILQ
ncbi:MAG: hypothetical protein ACYTFW_00255 [Planctomycetota bacterium]